MARRSTRALSLAVICCSAIWSSTFVAQRPKASLSSLHVAAAGLALPMMDVARANAENFSFLGKNSAELFPVSNVSLLTWGLLIFLPSWEYLKPAALVAPVVNAVLYVATISFLLTHPDPASADLLSLDGIVTAFRNPDGVLAGWLHYCVFDPLVGLGEVLDSQQNKVPHFLVVPCLILTLLFGPMGFLSYLAVRTVCLASRPA
eukprot:s2378_g6.t1